MKSRIIAHIPYELVRAAILLGWLERPVRAAAPHSFYSIDMEWVCSCGRAPVMPGRAAHG